MFSEPPIPKLPALVFKSQLFTFIKDRRNATKIYGADDGKAFLRFGPADEIEKELTFHKHLIEQGYPVPSIIESGEWTGDDRYYLETSAGDEKFGIMFKNDIAEHGVVSDATFNDFSAIIQRYLDAQQKAETLEHDWDAVFVGIHFDFLLEELPDQREQIMAVWEKVKTDLANVPFVLCHGDFNAYNILPDGVIDFETAFNGPKGYDLVSAAASIDWFPTEGDYEIFAKYSFTPEQKQQLLNLQSESIAQYDTLFLLRSIWSVVRMDRFPKLQAWRYTKFQTLMDNYLAV